MPRKAYLKCYFGCLNDGHLHKFPNPNALKIEDINRFKEWKSVLEVAAQKKPDHYIFDNVRICDRHFDQCYRLPSYRLTRNAVPTLCLAICGVAPWISCKPLFKKLHLLSFPCMVIFECAKLVKLNINLFTCAKDIYPRNSRDSNRIVLPRIPRTSLYKKNCHVMCGYVYNKIPKEIKEMPHKKFVVILKQWLLEKCFYSVTEFLTTAK